MKIIRGDLQRNSLRPSAISITMNDIKPVNPQNKLMKFNEVPGYEIHQRSSFIALNDDQKEIGCISTRKNIENGHS